MEYRTARAEIPRELLAACQGFRADTPPIDPATQRPVTLWAARTYLRGLKCERAIEAIVSESD